jgi:UDP-hydrolysing UDP-N-acetyl-D-glucosamine 2-epimerase
MANRKIAVFTGNRAEYGMQYPILEALSNDERLEYYLLVSGAHLDDNFGRTIDEIKKDGFRIHATVDIEMNGDTLFDTTRAIGSGIMRLSEILKSLEPDIFVVYADRFEGFSALITATQMGIPTVHIEGGDITEGGALDDMVRHSMSKLAHIHFTTNEEASERLRKMGEEPWRVFTVGFPTIDLINEGKYASPHEIAERYNIDIERPIVIYTQHSITTEFDETSEQIAPAMEAMMTLASKGVQVVITFPNNDAGGASIAGSLEKLRAGEQRNLQVYKSLGRYYYHGFLNLCGKSGRGVCVGNSSSGIKETPAFGCPVVNIGDRQKGRLRAENVIDVGYNAVDICDAVTKCLDDEEFRKKCGECNNPYGTGGVGKKISDILANIELGKKLVQKKLTY